MQVDVVTAASGTYESTLKSEMAKSEVPTLFQVNGPVGLATWKDYCYDLKDSEVYKHLKSDDFALLSLIHISIFAPKGFRYCSRVMLRKPFGANIGNSNNFVAMSIIT